MKKQLITINPWFYTSIGHNYIYNQSIEKAALAQNWSFYAILPKKNILSPLTPNWIKAMDCPTVRHWHDLIEGRPYYRPRKMVRFKERMKYRFSLWQALKPLLKKADTSSILFLETFSPHDIEILKTILHFLPKKNLTIWLLYRYPAEFMKSEVDIYNKIHKQISALNIHLQLLTDSELLKTNLEKAFGLPFTVLPIPHVEGFEIDIPKQKSLINCWWPGVVREGKGLSIIQGFAASQNENNKLFHLIAAQSAALPTLDHGPEITLLADHLSREDYASWMNKSDLILLPYTDIHYKEATSGIFIESIMAGKIPIVYPGTWMAYELEKHQIHELIINWDTENLATTLLTIYQNPTIRTKVDQLREYYSSFHNLNSFADHFRKLQKETV